ncbi:hypothetical protein JCM11641_000955 [Rhodosporidiobolus odoratus]
MDQDAFRQLLQTPAASTSTSTTSQPRSRFGAPAPKPSLPAGKATDFKPRKPKKDYKPKKAPDGSVYRDRAAERRLGKDGDFAEAEKLLEDFRTRSEREDVDRETFEKQMQYLGGDAQHSILVKGLDMSLLERMKHDQAKQAEAALDDVEDELDRAMKAGPSTGASTGAAAEPVKNSKMQKKTGKSRDELLAELKAMRAGGAPAIEKEEPAEKKDSRFKPLGGGGPDKGKGKEQPAPLGNGWKKVASQPAEGEKKKRKKKKVVAPTAAADTATASVKTSPPQLTKPPPSAGPPGASIGADDEDDDDIFGGAGDYQGLDSDSDSDSAASKPPPLALSADLSPSAVNTSTKRKYFDDDEDANEPVSTAPSAVTDLAAQQAAANAASSSFGSSRRRSGGDGDGGDSEDEEDVPMRLQGLSGGGPSVKELLELDKAAEEEDQRKAKKAKYQAKAAEKRELREKNMTEADKLNKEYQEMMNHLAKKEGKSGATEGNE